MVVLLHALMLLNVLLAFRWAERSFGSVFGSGHLEHSQMPFLPSAAALVILVQI